MRLLILNCSARKHGPAEPCPAIERYHGPPWQVVRHFQRKLPLLATDLHVYGLSAKYGLIPSSQPIPHYDQTLTPASAAVLRPQVLAAFTQLMAHGYAQLCLGLSRRYVNVLNGWEALVPPSTEVQLADGPMGTKLGQLRAWLEGRVWEPQARPTHIAALATPRGAVVLAGVPLALSREEVLVRGRTAFGLDGQNAARYRDWYVLLDDVPVAAKWLVSVISGVPTTKFDTANARRVLLALGVAVERAGGGVRHV